MLRKVFGFNKNTKPNRRKYKKPLRKSIKINSRFSTTKF